MIMQQTKLQIFKMQFKNSEICLLHYYYYHYYYHYYYYYNAIKICKFVFCNSPTKRSSDRNANFIVLGFS